LATGGSAAAGAVIGPSIAKAHAPAAAAPPVASAEHGGGEEGAGETAASLDPIIVDIRESDGAMHHLKVGIAIELAKGVTDEEFKRHVPRIRDAAISYLRSLKFDEISSPSKFDPIRAELGERIGHAAGKGKVNRVLFTDFVAQ
jgi:flagellar FliL protein